MVSSQKFLEKCRALSIKNENSELAQEVFEQGQVVARGFADLGYEEFIMLSPAKICSLYSGKVSELPPEERKHFFPVPDADMLIKQIIKAEYDVISMVYQDQRSWIVNLKNINTDQLVKFEGESLRDALIETFSGLK